MHGIDLVIVQRRAIDPLLLVSLRVRVRFNLAEMAVLLP
jgi:hypothetical protein